MPNVSTSGNSNGNTLALARSPDPQAERRRRSVFSYQWALGDQKKSRLARFPWITLVITAITCGIWCVTAYQVALNAGAHTLKEVLANIFANNEDVNVLIAFGAKYDPAILAGQYWRLITPIFLHANILHIGLNMFNFLLLGLIVERIFGRLRFILIYLITGVISVLASFVFAPQEISVGASGAIFGLVGAYSAFILVHRLAFRYHGITALGWLILVIGINLGLGFVIPNVDNYAHVGGLLSGCLLGWFFTPFYRVNPVASTQNGLPMLIDVHSLKRRWPLALLLIALTLLSAIIAIQFVGG
jgi:membrane associated rhomboid family serine protease